MSETIQDIYNAAPAVLPLSGQELVPLWQSGASVATPVGNVLLGRRTFVSLSASPSGTTSVYPTMKMMGLAGTFTPKVSGLVALFISFSGISSLADGAGGFTAMAAYGTGTAPVNGATATGTLTGNSCTGYSPAATANVPCSVIGLLSGLTIGTVYWIDLQLASVIAGTASVQAVQIVAFDL